MREPFISVKRPRLSPDGGYICDGCGQVVRMIGCDGQRFLCHECMTGKKEKQPTTEAEAEKNA